MKKIFVIFIVTMFVVTIPVGNSMENIFESNAIDSKQYYETSIDFEIENLLKMVNESILSYYLEKFVSFGFKMTGSDNCSRAADWIKQEFENIGLTTYFDEWKFPRYEDKNVVAIHNGDDPNSDAVIVVSAHYDTIGHSPGANDDGSGIAAMLTIANITSKLSFNHTVRFIAVSGEEVGTYGSFADAKNSYEAGENIIAVLNIDMVGYADKDDEKIIQIFGSKRADWIIEFSKDICNRYSMFFNLTIQYSLQYPADHESYNDFGFDGVQFIQPRPEDAYWFHSPEDTIDRINFRYLSNVTKMLLALTFSLSQRSISIQVKIIEPYEGSMYLFDTPIFKLPCYNLYWTRIRGLTYLFGESTFKVDIYTDEVINSVYFGVDDYIRNVCKEPPWEWEIGSGPYSFFTLHGFHRLTVCVTTNSGIVGYDEMDVYIVLPL